MLKIFSVFKLVALYTLCLCPAMVFADAPQNASGTPVPAISTEQSLGTPTLTGVFPNSGSMNGGSIITLTGRNFSAMTTKVDFGSTPASSFTVNNSRTITAIAPAGVSGIVDIQVTTARGITPKSAGDKFTYGKAYEYITDANPKSGFVVYCELLKSGGVTEPSCKKMSSPPPAPLNVSGIALATARNNKQYAYVTNITFPTLGSQSSVFQCPVNSDGSFAKCSDAGGGSFVAPTGINIATFNNTQYAYIADERNNTVSQCPININGSLGACSSTPSSEAPWEGTDHSVTDVNFTNVSGILYAYVTDIKYNTATTTGYVWRCLVNPKNGAFSSCIDASALSAGGAPAAIAFATVSGTQYAYIGQNTGPGLYQCSFNNTDGTFSSCAGTVPKHLFGDQVTGIQFANVDGAQIGLLETLFDSVYMCGISSSNGNLQSCQSAPWAVPVTQAVSGAVGYIK